MSRPGPVARLRQGSPRQRVLAASGFALAGVAVAVLSLAVTGFSSGPAVWWPASGLWAIGALVFARKSRWYYLIVIGFVGTTISFAAGRPPGAALVLGVGQLVEIAVVTRFVNEREGKPAFESSGDVSRFLIGIACGALALGTFGVVAIYVQSGIWDGFVLLQFAASHSSALVIIPPLALSRIPKRPRGTRPKRWLHFGILILVVAVVFWPGTTLPLSFLPLPLLAWATFRFNMNFVALELLVTSVIVTTLTFLGGGPFASPERGAHAQAALVDFFLLIVGSSILALAAAQNDRIRLDEERFAREALFRQGAVAASSGFVILQEDAGTINVLDANESGNQLLGLVPRETYLQGTKLTELIANDEGATKLLEEVVTFATISKLLNHSFDVTSPTRVTTSLNILLHRLPGTTRGELILLEVIDITASRETEAALNRLLDGERALAAELRDLAQQRAEFVSSVSHELRTPIASVMGFSEELLQTSLDQDQRSYANIIDRNANRLATLVENILTLSRLSTEPTRNIVGPAQPTDFRQVIESTLEDLRLQITERNIRVLADFPDESVTVAAPPEDVTRVVINILTNAIKFSPPRGTLTVTLGHDNRRASLSIDDEGPGIPSSDLQRVFDPFFRSAHATETAVPGTGLGLSITRGILNRCGGTIQLESDGENGTKASVRIPKFHQA